MVHLKKPMILAALALGMIIMASLLFTKPSPVYAEACSAGTVVWGTNVGGYTGECWSGEQYYAHAWTYSKPGNAYYTLKAWVQWWETCNGVYGGGGSAGPVTAYNALWVQAKGPWHGYYCSGTQSHNYLGRGQHTNTTKNEVVYSNYP